MTVGVVTGFEYNDREYDVPTSKAERKRFTDELIAELEALDGVANVFHAGTSQTGQSIRLEIEPEAHEDEWNSCYILDADPRSLSPRIRNTFEGFTPVSSYDVLTTPEPKNAEKNQYNTALYIAEAWFY